MKTANASEKDEEWFITDYDCYVDGLYDKLGEYANLDELNYMASKLDEMSQYDYDRFEAALSMGDYTGSIQDMINLCENLDCYEVYSNIHDDDDLGRFYIEECGAMSVPEHLQNYIDYEAYGRDVRFEEGGEYTDAGYVYNNGSSFHEYYDGDRDSIPDEYRVMSSPDGDELEEPEIEHSPEVTVLAADIDQAFRDHLPEYATYFPKEEVQRRVLADTLAGGGSPKIKTGLINMGRENGATEEIADLIDRLDTFERDYGINTYLVYQLKSGNEMRDLRFEPLDRLHDAGHIVDPANYELVYAAPLTPGENLESIYRDLNVEHPSDYHARSLSMSDIVVMREQGKETAHYCDTVGFAEVREFLDPAFAPDTLETGDTVRTPRGSFHLTSMTKEQMQAAGYGVHHQSEDGKYLIMGNGTRAFAVSAEKDNPLRTAEMTIEDDYGMIDGIINNGRRDEPTGKESIVARLEAAKKECAERKPPEKKSPGRNVPEHGDL